MSTKRQALRCSAKVRSTGEQCKKYAMTGGTVCDTHGGMSPVVRAKARTRVAEQKLQKELARLKLPPVENPLQEMALVTAQVIWWKDQIAQRVNDLTALRYSTEGGEQLRAEVALFERALDRCEKFLATMARLNIDERLIKIEQAKADMIIAAVDAALHSAGITGERAADAKKEAARHLRAV